MNPAAQDPPAKKMKFSPSNVDEYERVFRLEHDVAMGYATPTVPRVPKVKTALELFMEQNPVPSPLHDSFRCWIERNANAKFDCFEEPSWQCVCYKCVAWQKKIDHEMAIMEAIKTDHEESHKQDDLTGMSRTDRLFTLAQSTQIDKYVATAITVQPRNDHTKFDCFEEPNWLCTCYKCLTWQESIDSEIAGMEVIKAEQESMYERTNRAGVTTTSRLVPSEKSSPAPNTVYTANRMQTTCADVLSTVHANNVCHFYVDFDMVKSEHPQTPKLTTLTFTAPDSDHGKEEAQRKWARRMSLTPNNLHL